VQAVGPKFFFPEQLSCFSGPAADNSGYNPATPDWPMKKSKRVNLTLCTAVAAAAMSGCNRIREAQVQRCINDANVMVEDRNCETSPYSGVAGGSGSYGPRHRWVYGGNGGYAPGSVVYDAHDTPTDGMGTVRGSELAARGYAEGGGRLGIAESGGFTTPPSSRGGFGALGRAFSGSGHCSLALIRG
jgi:hypothetical protein